MLPRSGEGGGAWRFRLRRVNQIRKTAAMAAGTNARNGQDVKRAGRPLATTVTVHSRETISEPSDTVTFTTGLPGADDAKLSALVVPPATGPSNRHVDASPSPSGSHAMTV